MSSDTRVVKSAAVYARISADPHGQGLGVQRQLEDCRKLAASRGWIVGQEYVDNDVSAYSGKERPAYAQMISDLEAGFRDAVIVYNLDRLHRRPSELEEFVTLCESAGVRDVATVTADIDLGNDDGLFMARIFAAFAAKESGRKSARMKRKWEQTAAAGQPGGWARAFGYEPDMITVRESEAVVLREAVERYIAGESIYSLAKWLNEIEVPTPKDGQWSGNSLRQVFVSGRIAGLREHRGQVVATAVWEPIITVEQREQVLARLAVQRKLGRRTPRTHLLSGLLTCGKCEAPLYSHSRETVTSGGNKKSRRYICLSRPGWKGCGKLAVVANPVEELIVEAVLTRLDSPAVAKAMAGRENEDQEVTVLSEKLAADQRKLEELAGLYADNALTAREWIAARNPIQARIRDTERQLAHSTGNTALHGLAGKGGELRGQWADLPFERRHAIVKAVLDHAVIAPGKGGWVFDINRVRPRWRV
ncbi:MAG: recombinase family protein [Segniliparus sp.]|uniref:recombinase family protein n=1 Tax=Segniliparus sp. TaxID=2804064 RepID=UPI003F3680A9